jgi:ABC-type protease/lipase transport system fused ATPase/permease subunit
MKILSFLGDLPDNVLSRALKEGYGPMGWAFLFSLVVNVLFLAMPLYTYQVYGRVLQSQNEATLWILTFVTIGVFAVSSVVDSFGR